MLRTMRRRKAFAVTRISRRSPCRTTRSSARCRTVRPCASAPMRGEVSLAEHACRSRPHGGHVEGFVDLERPMSVERVPNSVHSDPIAIDAPARLSPRIEARRRGSKGAHGQVGRQRGVQPSSQLRQSAAATRCSCVAECRDLAGGMHPGIGSPGETNSRCLADQPVKRLLQLPLNGPSIRLDLGAGEGRSVVLDHRSCASLRVGGHRSVSVF